MDEGLARRPDQRRARAPPALRAVEEPLVAAVRGDAALDSGHRLLPLAGVRHEALELVLVDIGDDRLAGVPAGPSARLDLEVMAAPGLRPDPLPGAGLPVALGRPLVGLHLRHGCLSTFPAVPASRPRGRAPVGCPWPRSRRRSSPRRRPAGLMASATAPRRRPHRSSFRRASRAAP